MKLIIASNNKHKIKEIKAILGGSFEEIVSISEAGISHETVEDGKTFMENARKKAREIAEISGFAALADDSGICAHALDGAPGVYSARYAGEHGNDAANNELLLRKLSDKEDRSAKFVCTIGCVFPAGERVCRGETEGVIIDEYRGKGGFGYDPLFLYEPTGKTFAEMSGEEKNAISHRGKAIELFAKALAELK